jgi:hypothetical protein
MKAEIFPKVAVSVDLFFEHALIDFVVLKITEASNV